MLNDLKTTPQSTKNIELEWWEYLLPRSEQERYSDFSSRWEDHRAPRPPQMETSNNNNVYFLVFLLILGFGSISFLVSFALTVLGIMP